MSAHEREVDRVASAMTAGAPHATFTGRVMAPIRGVPQPGFTGRVMAAIELAPRPARWTMVSRSLGPGLAAAAAFAMIAALWRPGDVPLPMTSAPALVNARVGAPAFVTPDPGAIVPAGMPRAARRTASTPGASQARLAAALPDPERPLYRIAQLEPPAGLAIRAIAPAPPDVAPLDRPTALIVPGLRFEKEKP